LRFLNVISPAVLKPWCHANVTLNVEEVQREFMMARLKFAVRQRKSGRRGGIPPDFFRVVPEPRSAREGL
jgi:hypothetical protein